MKFLIAVSCALVALVAAAPQAPAPAPSAGKEKHAPPTLPGGCPQFTPVASFDAQKLSGEWFLVNGALQGLEKEPKKCASKTLTLKPDGSFEVKASAIKGSDNQKKTKTFTSTPVTGSPGKFTLSGGEEHDPKYTKTITIIDTDYTDYAVSATCVTDGQVHGILIGVNSRQKTLGAGSLDKAKAALKAQSLSEDLTAIDQNC